MYFEIENTPEHIRRARRKEIVRKNSPKEECPRLLLAPFSRPPQIVFENVLIGTTCERRLEVCNPSNQIQQITLGRALPPGLVIEFPNEGLEVEPETCYTLNMVWTPLQPIALRETIRFTNENRGRYDVIVVLKSTVNIKGKSNQPKGFKTSPGKIKKIISKKSPVSVYKKKSEKIYKSTQIKNTVSMTQYTEHRILKSSNKENISNFNDYSIQSYSEKCPFDSPTSADLNFDTSEIFSNLRRNCDEKILQNTYDKSYKMGPQNNVLKPTNKQIKNTSASDLSFQIDNLTFTPLKTLNAKSEKLNKGPKIILSMNSDSELDDSLDLKLDNKENDMRSVVYVTSTQPQNEWLTINHPPHAQINNQLEETPNIQNRKIPNTSSPKELHSPNFSINTEFSRISDLSFAPPMYSTERKIFPKVNETHELLEEPIKFSSDTYTKDSPNTTMEQYNQMYADQRLKQNSKMCRHALFREYQQPHDLRSDIKSPPRSLTPPLHSIPEESVQLSDTHVLDKMDKQTTTFTINRTFDKLPERNSISSTNRNSWAKKAIRAEPEIWKVPIALPRKSLKPKLSINNKKSLSENNSMCKNISLNKVGNVYSQSFTVDPFMSSTYFYDEEAVDKFEVEFRRWLNYILTPPADLDSNVEQKIDVGKAWLENRNVEVPAAPTKEQVCSVYHNSHRLESLRRAARALLTNPEISQVFQKLNAQVEKKLIAIRNDRNLHLDVGLQKIIMELLLSYNPLWLRIGLETIYGIVLPLKSNSDIEGLTSFIIQRMFKNPHLKNKHSKSSAPNMLLPAYMDAIKKFTLKKFFMLVFFLDQAKQRKLISHDPCLFCRNAVCKESREVIIRFTREVIAGIGDITKHLRPLGYVVCHKQSYLDEYKYAVHNIAVDLRDGVRLTKVMEIILMKNGLLNQLRTPAISRLQKIHNVQVALNSLKEANFAIVGDITANDIADGHREKTLSLLWQLIHVFRAPLFVKAANFIQTWWRKKYEVIMEKRREEEKLRQKQANAASVIQCWWRRIQYNRLVEWQMKQITTATIVVQKYCRKWLCRTRFLKMKNSILKIEEWYKSTIIIRESKKTLERLKKEKQELLHRSSTLLQSYVRRWLCMKRFKESVRKIILIQTKLRAQNLMKQEKLRYTTLRAACITIQRYYRAYITGKKQREEYLKLKKATIILQRRYKAQLLMKEYRNSYLLKRCSAITIQRKYRAQALMLLEKSRYQKLREAAIVFQRVYRAKQAGVYQHDVFMKMKSAAKSIQRWFRNILQMRRIRKQYLQLRNTVVLIQSHYRGNQVRREIRRKKAAHKIQSWFLSIQKRNEYHNKYLALKKNTVFLQATYRMHVLRKKFLTIKKATITIQRYYRSYKLTQYCRQQYIQVRMNIVTLQSYVRAHIARHHYLKIRSAAVTIQAAYRLKRKQDLIKRQRAGAIVLQKYCRKWLCRTRFLKIKYSVLKIEEWYKNVKMIREAKQSLERLKKEKQELRNKLIQNAVVMIQARLRAQNLMKQEKLRYTALRAACITIQKYYRTHIIAKKQRDEYLKLKQATIILQRRFKAQIAMIECRKSYLSIRCATITIQRRYKAQALMLLEKTRFRKVREATIVIQRIHRAKQAGEKQRNIFMTKKSSAISIQRWFRNILEMRIIRKQYLQLKNVAILIQSHHRGNQVRREIRRQKAARKIQSWFISIQKANECRNKYLTLKKNVIFLQAIYRMNVIRKRFLTIKKAAITIQSYYRSYKLTQHCRQQYVQIRRNIITLQSYVRTHIKRHHYLKIRSAAITIQTAYRLKRKQNLIKKERTDAAICIQKNVRRYLVQSRYQKYRQHVIFLQKIWKGKLITRLMCCEYLQKRRMVVRLQAMARGYLVRKRVQVKKEEMQKVREEQRREYAASKIQALFRGHKVRVAVTADCRIAKLRQRWRQGALRSTQESLKERNEEAIEVLRNMRDIETIIKAFRSLELLTEVFPMMYTNNASSIVDRMYIYMSVTNRSISSVEVLKSAAAILVNLTRYKITGPKVYKRDRISPILKFMLRFSNSDIQLFCILCTYLWLFSKYQDVKEDLTKCLHIPEHNKMLTTIKNNVERMKRMANNARSKFYTPQSTKFVSHTGNRDMNHSICSNKGNNSSGLLPSLEPDYGIVRADQPRYFEDAHHAITSLFRTYNL